MFIYASFLAMAFTPTSLAAPALTKINSRVAGGNLAEPGEFPFVVAPQLNGLQWCAGTLLNAYTVLTAAHCSINNPPENVTIRAGSMKWHSGGTVSNITEIKIHPSYRPVVGHYDVAVWHLATPIQPSDKISYAKTVAQGYEPPVGLNATTAGWGDTSPDQTVKGSEELRWVNVPVHSRQDCEGYGQISPTQICAGGEEGKGSCPRDSGGPIWNAETGEVIGTVSSGGGCGQKGLPILYTNLGSMSDWVRQNSWSA
ncbi:trypsin-like cysteine/serine peptidase domain-containing protein [Rhexocercosporidium sp. MPI-PUGE-AT-0058]|nr:trypsin-like cysteine/serine peptidase domain-containing protein [Rhexocercosporidium sp. MPI-PUGE-AT-0058]